MAATKRFIAMLGAHWAGDGPVTSADVGAAGAHDLGARAAASRRSVRS